MLFGSLMVINILCLWGVVFEGARKERESVIEIVKREKRRKIVVVGILEMGFSFDWVDFGLI